MPQNILYLEKFTAFLSRLEEMIIAFFAPFFNAAGSIRTLDLTICGLYYKSFTIVIYDRNDSTIT